MTQHAKGAFDDGHAAEFRGSGLEMVGLFRSEFDDKRFHGDLEAHRAGEMLAAMTETQGPAGYVAIERVDGTLHGRKGTFILQHIGVMNRGASDLTIIVVPDSATGELVGLTGTRSIQIESGQHFYDLTYSLPAQ